MAEIYRYYIPWIAMWNGERAWEIRHGHFHADFDRAIETYEDVLAVRRQVAEHFKIESPESITILDWKRL